MYSGKEGKRNIFILAVIITGFTLFYMLYSQPASSMSFDPDTSVITFYGPKSTSASFDLHDITGLKLVTKADAGSAVNGGTLFGDNLYGTWSSNSIGSYQAFMTSRIRSYIVISDPEKTAAFNYSDDKTVASLYEQLEKYVQGLK